MPKLKITKDKNGMYHTRVYGPFDENGKRITKRVTGYTEREVRREAEDFLEEMKRQPKAFGMTLKEAAEKYLDYLGSKKKPISPSTMRTYSEYAKNHFQSLLNVPIVSITESMIQDEIYKMELTRSGKTIHNVVNFFIPCIKHFRRRFNIELDMPPVEKPTISIPDTEEIKEKIHTIKDKGLKIAVLLAAYCGMRRGEISALDLQNDIEYDQIININGRKHKIAVIHINKAYAMDKTRTFVIKSTKTEAGERDQFAPEWLNNILKDARDDPNFKMPSPSYISDNFRYWTKKNNINTTFHGLRHFYASIMKALNIPDNYAMLLMGHTTDKMLQRYQEIMNDKQKEINRDLLVFVEKNAPLHHENAPLNNSEQEKTRKTYKIKRKIEDLKL